MGLRSIAETIGKAIPNEISKLNSVTKYIPFLGQFSQAISSADAGLTAFGDTGDYQAGFQQGMMGFQGSTDPGSLGSGGDINKDIFNIIGQAGNIFSNPQGIMGNQYLGTENFGLDSLLGGQEQNTYELPGFNPYVSTGLGYGDLTGQNQFPQFSMFNQPMAPLAQFGGM